MRAEQRGLSGRLLVSPLFTAFHQIVVLFFFFFSKSSARLEVQGTKKEGGANSWDQPSSLYDVIKGSLNELKCSFFFFSSKFLKSASDFFLPFSRCFCLFVWLHCRFLTSEKKKTFTPQWRASERKNERKTRSLFHSAFALHCVNSSRPSILPPSLHSFLSSDIEGRK